MSGRGLPFVHREGERGGGGETCGSHVVARRTGDMAGRAGQAERREIVREVRLMVAFGSKLVNLLGLLGGAVSLSTYRT